MSTPTHECSVPGCGVVIPARHLMCPAHWQRVPKTVQAKVYGVARSHSRGKATLADLRAVQARATAAVAAASATPAAEGGAA